MPAAHTPGPWSVGSHRSIQSPAGTICETYSHMGIEEADANERLIAAAPELLAAMRAFLQHSVDVPFKHLPMEVMRPMMEAVAKATGKAF